MGRIPGGGIPLKPPVLRAGARLRRRATRSHLPERRSGQRTTHSARGRTGEPPWSGEAPAAGPYKSRESGFAGAKPVNLVLPLTIKVTDPEIFKPLGPRSTYSIFASGA